MKTCSREPVNYLLLNYLASYIRNTSIKAPYFKKRETFRTTSMSIYTQCLRYLARRSCHRLPAFRILLQRVPQQHQSKPSVPSCRLFKTTETPISLCVHYLPSYRADRKHCRLNESKRVCKAAWHKDELDISPLVLSSEVDRLQRAFR